LCNWAWCYLKGKTKKTETDLEKDVIKDSELLLLAEKAFTIERENAADRQSDVLTAFNDGEADASTTTRHP